MCNSEDARKVVKVAGVNHPKQQSTKKVKTGRSGWRQVSEEEINDLYEQE